MSVSSVGSSSPNVSLGSGPPVGSDPSVSTPRSVSSAQQSGAAQKANNTPLEPAPSGGTSQLVSESSSSGYSSGLYESASQSVAPSNPQSSYSGYYDPLALVCRDESAAAPRATTSEETLTCEAPQAASGAAPAPSTAGAPATADLPEISAGTPPVSERAHAGAADLVQVDRAGRPAGTPGAGPAAQSITPEAAEAFRRMREYAARDGINVDERFNAYSTFRPDAHQAALNAKDPESAKNGFRAKAGTSTHRTGNALDITVSHGSTIRNNDSKLRDELHKDPASQWLEQNAAKFGFAVLGVSKESDGTVTHADHWEPWHITFNPVDGATLPPPISTDASE